MKNNDEVYWAVIGKKYIPLSADTLRGAKNESTRIAKPVSRITIMLANRAVARKQGGEWLHV